MSLDFATLELLRQNHPAWRLLRAQNAPLIAAFLHRVFILPNVRNLPQTTLASELEAELYAARELKQDENAFPESAQDYLNQWADSSRGWLRKFYPMGQDEPHFDLTPATEKALRWLENLNERSFVGTESRLLTLFELLRQISAGSQTDPELRMAELQKRKDELEAEMARIRAGVVPILDDARLKDRFQQFLQLARELLADFREVEDNFRDLDRRSRERMAQWSGGRGELLERIMTERDAIAGSDQGRSFRAFWDFLMSPAHQEELERLLADALALPALQEMARESGQRLRHISADWLEAGDHAQRTVALLSAQLRKFLDDRAWLENRRIMELLHQIEQRALSVREAAPRGDFMTVAGTAAGISLPLERPPYRVPEKVAITTAAVDEGDAELDLSQLYAQVAIDREELAQNIRASLRGRGQCSLAEVIAAHPLRHGLSELVSYLSLADEWPRRIVEEGAVDEILWEVAPDLIRRARTPRIILVEEP